MKKISIMKKRFLIIVCILYSSVTFAYAELMGTNDSTILNVIVDKNIEIFYNKRKIPRKLKKIIKEKYDIRFRIANPSELCNKSDVVTYPFLSNRQLVFGGKKEDYCFFVYNRYGRGNATYFIFFDCNSLELNVYGVSNKIKCLDDLIRAILEKRYCIKDFVL